MPGTKAGAKKAAAKNLANDPDFYKKIGRKGGSNGTTGGFAANPKLAQKAGKLGGQRSAESRRNRRWHVTLVVRDERVKTFIVYADDYKEAATKGSQKFIDKGFSSEEARLEIQKG